VAPRFPLFSALVRFLTSPPDEPDEPGAAAPGEDGEWEARGGGGHAVLAKRPRLAVRPSAPDFVDRPDPFRVALGPVATHLPSMALSAALEFASVCLDASACVAGASPAAYIVALDADEDEGLRSAVAVRRVRPPSRAP